MTDTQLPLQVAQSVLARAHQARTQVATDDEAKAVAAAMLAQARSLIQATWEPYPWQHPHLHPEGWVSQRAPGVCDERCAQLPAVKVPNQGMWLEYGGRGTGKTEGAAHYVNDHAEGPPCDTRVAGGHKMLIVGPTQGDAVDAAVTGISGLQTINPAISVTTSLGGTFVRWPNGTRARVLGASTPEDIKRLRASGNNCLIYLEEVAAMRRLQEVLDISRFGLRTGDHAHYVAATTPKNRPEMKALAADPDTIITRGRTRDAHRLNPVDRQKWEERYGGTTLGRQELDAEELDDVEGALWVHRRLDLVDGQPNKDERPGIENDRVKIGAVGWVSHNPDQPTVLAPLMLDKVVVGVDPPGGRTEAGIVVVGFRGGHSYTLADLSIAGPPDTWARLAIQAYLDFGAVGLVTEHAYGGDMVDAVLGTAAEALGIPALPIFRAKTKVGKRLRAEPVQAMSQQHRVHHVGSFPLLESEQTGWVEDESTESPNRLDAWVHANTWGLVQARTATASSATSSKTRIPGR